MYSDITNRLDGIDERLGGVENRLDGIDEKLGGVDNRLDGIDLRLDGLDADVKKLGNQLTKLEVELKDDIKALYDGYKQTYEKVTFLESKLDKQEVEIRVVKGGK